VLRALYEVASGRLNILTGARHALKNFEKLREVCDSELKEMYLGVGNHQRCGGGKKIY
jgi:ribosomal protein S12 methylthiotransferase accessory factor YcaO